MTWYYGLNESSCKAVSSSNIPLDKDSDMEGVDVAKRFKIAIIWSFFMSKINFERALATQIAIWREWWVLLLVSYAIYAINIAIFIMLFVMANLWRW